MQLIPRRKRTWLLVLLGIVIVGAAEIWWAATKKSEFEGKFGQIAIGISKEVALQLMPDDQASVFQSVPPVALTRYEWAVDGEECYLTFSNDRLIEKGFIPLDTRNRLRRLWVRWLNSNPPF